MAENMDLSPYRPKGTVPILFGTPFALSKAINYAE